MRRAQGDTEASGRSPGLQGRPDGKGATLETDPSQEDIGKVGSRHAAGRK